MPRGVPSGNDADAGSRKPTNEYSAPPDQAKKKNDR